MQRSELLYRTPSQNPTLSPSSRSCRVLRKGIETSLKGIEYCLELLRGHVSEENGGAGSAEI